MFLTIACDSAETLKK